MIKTTVVLLCTLILLSIAPHQKVLSENMVEMQIISFPPGATVTANGVELGRTPLKLHLAPQQYSMEFELAGFETYHMNYIIFNNDLIGVALTPNQNFIDVPSQTVYAWLPNANTLSFKNRYAESSPIYYLDLDNNSVVDHQFPVGWLTDEALRAMLAIPSATDNSRLAWAYTSPTGRYIYHVREINGEYETAIYDIQTQQVFTTGITVPDNVTASTYFPSIRWHETPDSTQLLVNSGGAWTCDYLFTITETQINKLDCVQVSDANGTRIGVFNRFFDVPTAEGWMVASAQGALFNDRIMLLNIYTQEFKAFPFDQVFGAKISPDGSHVYVAHTDGISLLAIDTLEEIAFITDEVAGIWGVRHVSFADTGDYAIVWASAGSEFDAVYIYQMPPATPNE